jgi:glyoxylase-like metal-dependent hydrolase (beta-lactamase superfamily II)
MAEEPVNRINQQLSEVADGVAVVESLSHCVVIATGAGLVAFDTSGPATGARVVDAIRGWSKAPLHTIVYTHGHLDHVGGSDEAERRHGLRLRVVSHEAVRTRFARYRRTDGWNRTKGQRTPIRIAPQFGLA